MIVAMAMATGLTAGAAETKTNLFNMTQIERYQLNVNNKRIAKTLELTNAQTAFLEFLHNRMNERLIKIYEAGGNEEDPDPLTMEDMDALGLAGGEGAMERREALGKALGIGSGNAKAMLKKINGFGISRKEIWDAVKKDTI